MLIPRKVVKYVYCALSRLVFLSFPKLHILINLQTLAGVLKELNWPARIRTQTYQKKATFQIFLIPRLTKLKLLSYFIIWIPEKYVDWYLDLVEAFWNVWEMFGKMQLSSSSMWIILKSSMHLLCLGLQFDFYSTLLFSICQYEW